MMVRTMLKNGKNHRNTNEQFKRTFEKKRVANSGFICVTLL